ncbi:MAG: secretion protein [Candidatus Omnitrophota bacterium]|jgi:tight adherence protein B|nr:MAG: secretion protein [Candidatus Omnitrophota bacterium]
MSPQVLVGVVFLCTTLFIFGLVFFIKIMFSSESAAVDKRVESLGRQSAKIDFNKQALAIMRKQKDWDRYTVFSEFPPFLNLPLLFEQSGSNSDVGSWLLTRFSIAGCIGFVTWFKTANPLYAITAFGLVIVVAYLKILYNRKQRISRFEADFAHALEIIGRSLRAGHPFSMGLKMAATELPDPIGCEFGRVFREQQMGLPIEESLRSMTRRIPLMDVRFFALTIMIHQQIGGDLAEVLDKLSNVIRERFKVLGQVKALTAEGRLSGWVLCLLPIIVFFIIMVINPGYINVLLETELGNKMLKGAITMQIIGVFIIRKIVNIKV